MWEASVVCAIIFAMLKCLKYASICVIFLKQI